MNTHSPHRCKGLSLVEILVSLVIGLFLLGGMIGVFVSTRETSLLRAELDRVTEAYRFGAYALARQVRQATGVVNTSTNNSLTINIPAASVNCLGTTGGPMTFQVVNQELRCNGQAIAEGMSSVAFLYGYDSDGDKVVSSGEYVAASNVPTAAWANVVSVRVTFTMQPLKPGAATRAESFTTTLRNKVVGRDSAAGGGGGGGTLPAAVTLKLLATDANGTPLGRTSSAAEGASFYLKVLAYNTADDTPVVGAAGVLGLTATRGLNTTVGDLSAIPSTISIGTPLKLDLTDDHMLEGNETLTLSISSPVSSSNLSGVTVTVQGDPVTLTLQDGAANEPDQAIGALDTVTLKVIATDAAGTPLVTQLANSAQEGSSLYYKVVALDPAGNALTVSPTNPSVEIEITYPGTNAATGGGTDFTPPASLLRPLNQVFSIPLTTDTLYTEATETFLVGVKPKVLADQAAELRAAFENIEESPDKVTSSVVNVPAGVSVIGYVTGANSISEIPSYQAGDVVLGFAFRDDSNTCQTEEIPAKPNDTWISLSTATNGNACSRLAYRIATSASSIPANETWSNATSLIYIIYRGLNATTPIGSTASSGGNSTTVTYKELSIASDNTSWVVGFVGHSSSNVNLSLPPSGMTNRIQRSATTERAAAHDTDGPVASWTPDKSVSVGGAIGRWQTWTVELKR